MTKAKLDELEFPERLAIQILCHSDSCYVNQIYTG